MTAPSTQHATPDPRLQCGILKKPKYLYSYTIKNFIKVKHSWKRISEQARIRKKRSLQLAHPITTRIPPQILSLWLFRWFSELFSSPTTQTVGYLGREEWGKGKTPQKRKQISSEENSAESVGPTVQKSQRTGWKLPVSQKSAGALHMQPWKILGS